MAWLAMLPVTMTVRQLRTAILFVALMSVWANFATHLGAWIAALVNVKAEAIHEHVRPDELLTSDSGEYKGATMSTTSIREPREPLSE